MLSKQDIKAILGMTMILVGVVVAFYVAIGLMFVGGIVQIIDELRSDNLVALNIAIGIVKILFSQSVGGLCGAFLILPGKSLLK